MSEHINKQSFLCDKVILKLSEVFYNEGAYNNKFRVIIIIKLLCFWTLSIILFLFKRTFRELKYLLVQVEPTPLTQSIELVINF
jgi:hypothetical protein